MKKELLELVKNQKRIFIILGVPEMNIDPRKYFTRSNILNKKKSYLQTLEDCESFLNNRNLSTYNNEIQYETVLLLYSLSRNMNL